MNTHGLTIEFGKHKGSLWTRVPIGYIKWVLTEGDMPETVKEIARAEMERRGTATPTIDVSGHAIDRASLRLRKTWHQTALNDDEGLHSWLCRMAAEALESGERLETGKVKYQGMKFVFIEDGDWPVLKTVMS